MKELRLFFHFYTNFLVFSDVMKQLQNDEDLWKENMVKSPVYGNRIRLYICSNILKGIVLIHRHRLLKLLSKSIMICFNWQVLDNQKL